MKIVGCSPDSFRVFVVLLCVPLAAQDANGLQARQLYYKSKSALEAGQKTTDQKTTEQKKTDSGQGTKSTTAGAGRHRLKTTESKAATEPNPLGLKYTIEQENSSGKYVQVDPDKTFGTGDAIRLRMEVNGDAYVYLLSRGASGDGNFLFPQPGEDNRLKAFQSVQVPAEPADPIRFAEPAGTETLFILVSRSPVPDLDRLLPARGSSPQQQPSNASLMAANVPKAQFTELVGHAEKLQSRDLVRGKVLPVSNTGSTTMNEHAVYAVNVSTTPGVQVLQKLELKHR